MIRTEGPFERYGATGLPLHTQCTVRHGFGSGTASATRVTVVVREFEGARANGLRARGAELIERSVGNAESEYINRPAESARLQHPSKILKRAARRNLSVRGLAASLLRGGTRNSRYQALGPAVGS